MTSRAYVGLFLIALLGACAGGAKTPNATPAPAGPAPERSPVVEPSVEVVRPCTKDSPEAKAALARLAALDAKIAALAANAPGEAQGKEIEAVLEQPCFALATLPYPFELDSGLAVKQWWSDGGKWWLENQLALGLPRDPKVAPGLTHHLIVPPSARTTLAADVQTASPLLPLLCPAAAALPDSTSSCGRETLGWMHRAAMAFVHSSEAQRAHLRDINPTPEPAATRDTCLAEALTAPKSAAFERYSDCMHASAQHSDALPLGRFAVPKDGWMILRGRRGHHGFCDEIRAYDLATGAAYIAKSCGGLEVDETGAVQPAATSESRRSRVEVGRVPVEALREAALLSLLSEDVDHDVVLSAFGWFIPAEVEIAMPKDRGLTLPGASEGWSSGRTTLAASWVLGGRIQARAAVEWPDSDEAAREHATELLTIAELGFVAGCAPAALPRLPWASLEPRADEETPAAAESPVYADLRAELERIPARSTCR